MSFGAGGGTGYGTRNEPITLATMERDCFIIPAHSLDRFLPDGIPVLNVHIVWFSLFLICLSIIPNTLYEYAQLPPPNGGCGGGDPNDNNNIVPATSPTAAAAAGGPLSVLEVADPKVCILAHLMSPLEPIEPILESPLAHPLLKQRSIAGELLSEVQQAQTATGAMLLANMERTGEL